MYCFIFNYFSCLYNYFLKTTLKKQSKTIKKCSYKTPCFCFQEYKTIFYFLVTKQGFLFFILEHIKMFLK